MQRLTRPAQLTIAGSVRLYMLLQSFDKSFTFELNPQSVIVNEIVNRSFIINEAEVKSQTALGHFSF